MSELHFPFLQLAILIALAGACCVGRVADRDRACRLSLWLSSAVLLCTVGAWLDLGWLGATEAHDRWDLLEQLTGRRLFTLDRFSAPLLPLTALLYLLTGVATLRTKIRRFSFAWTLFSEAITLALLACREPWGILVLLAVSTLPPYLELRARKKPTRVFGLHMGLSLLLLIVGWSCVEAEGLAGPHSLAALLPLLIGVLIRSGAAPLHCWMTDLFEHATFGTALLFVTPMTGAYAAIRLVLPTAPDWVLHSIGIVSLVTAVYAAGMALVQREARRFFCYLFLSHSSLVLVGLETATPIGLTGALCVWLSVALALAGFGLTLRTLEARHGRLMLLDYRGLYDRKPLLAACFLLTGMASVGFPGTFGFIGTELVVDGAVHSYPYMGIAVVVAAALNGIAVVKTYFLLFTGCRPTIQIPLGIGLRERFAVLTLAALILGGGLLPQPGVHSRHEAAVELLRGRQMSGAPAPKSFAEHVDHGTSRR